MRRPCAKRLRGSHYKQTLFVVRHGAQRSAEREPPLRLTPSWLTTNPCFRPAARSAGVPDLPLFAG